ncbi:MAG: polymer-forming cytoskeletal protein [Candidatus Nomurabacteria bacterium]|nr:MAG: polymer-forming cytoskeletal protein [Candidatus Nomurabacteria bacterium]
MLMKRWQKIVLSVAGVFLIPGIALAATIQSGNTYTLATSETLEGALYVAAGTVNVDGTVNGDVMVAGGTVTISGTVNGDVLATGGTVSVTGSVSEDIRLAGGQLTIATTVPGDVTVAGGSVTLEDNAEVMGDVLVAGGDQMLHGKIHGKVRAAGGDITLAGSIDGDVRVYAGALSVADGAVVNGDLTYSSEHEASIAAGANIVGTVHYDKTTYRLSYGLLGLTIVSLIIKFLALMVAAVVVAAGFRRYSEKIVHLGRMQIGKQFVIGLLVFIVTPIAFAILFSTVIGSMLGLLLLSIYIAVLIGAGIFAGILFGAMGMRFLKKDYPENGDWVSALLGVLVLQLIVLIPIVGWLVGCFFFLLALGSICTDKWVTIRGK